MYFKSYMRKNINSTVVKSTDYLARIFTALLKGRNPQSYIEGFLNSVEPASNDQKRGDDLFYSLKDIFIDAGIPEDISEDISLAISMVSFPEDDKARSEGESLFIRSLNKLFLYLLDNDVNIENSPKQFGEYVAKVYKKFVRNG